MTETDHIYVVLVEAYGGYPVGCVCTRRSDGSVFLPDGQPCPVEHTMTPDGQLLAKEMYPKLFEVVGYTYGGNDSHFRLPDLRGRFDVV